MCVCMWTRFLTDIASRVRSQSLLFSKPLSADRMSVNGGVGLQCTIVIRPHRRMRHIAADIVRSLSLRRCDVHPCEPCENG